jgi:hypothetical protein
MEMNFPAWIFSSFSALRLWPSQMKTAHSKGQIRLPRKNSVRKRERFRSSKVYRTGTRNRDQAEVSGPW